MMEQDLYMDKKILDGFKKKGMVALKYTKGEISSYQNLPPNPTGTIDDICGISDQSGRIFGMMPHPERGMFFTQKPNWPAVKEKLKRERQEIPDLADGIKIFQNGVNY